MNLKCFTGIIRILARQLHYKVYAGLIILIILAGCAKEAPNKSDDRTLRLGGLGGRPGPINAIITNQTISANLTDLVFSALVRINERMMPEPDLAERWSVSQDGLVYTFYLRKGVLFHPEIIGTPPRLRDGVEFTAQDCAFTYNAVLDLANNSPWRDNYTMIKTVKAEDRHTFVVTLNEPQASFINLMSFPIHLHTNGIGVGVNPVGTGPFRFVERSNESIILEANPDYYGGKPAINRIEARGYDTFAQYFSAFMKGETDMIQFLNTEQFETLARDPAFRAYSFPSIYTYMIDYNPAHPIFADKKVRQAMAHAINIPEIINKIESGLGIPSTGPFIPGAWFSCPVRSAHERENNPLIKSDSSLSDASNGADPFIKPFEYNPAQALRLLKEAGWESSAMNRTATSSGRIYPTSEHSAMNRTATLIKDGQEFRFTLLVDPKERITGTIAKIIYQDLYKIGVRCDIKTYDHNNQDKELVQEAGAAVISFMILATLEPNWHSDKQQIIGKLWRYTNPETDRLFEQANITQDFKHRQALYHKIHRLVYAEQSGTFLYCLPNLCAISNRFGNTDRFFSPALPFYTIKEWEINKPFK